LVPGWTLKNAPLGRQAGTLAANFMTHSLNFKEDLQDKFVAFLDVMGFSNLVNKGNVDNLESYFEKIIDELDALRRDKANIKSFLISDSIILIAPSGLKGFTQLLWAIRRIQSVILWRKILLRGAVSYGQVYYNKEHNIIVGKGFIRAYLLEKEAVYPRVIIDPSIIKQVSTDKQAFLKQINGTLEYAFEDRHIYTKSDFSEINDDGIFIDYANKSICKDELKGNLDKAYELIIENLYSEQKLYTKYVWLRDYFLETLRKTEYELNRSDNKLTEHKKSIKKWIEKFERL
jgi:hypothetical protein